MTENKNYIELDELKAALKIPAGTGSDAELTRAIASASRQIDEYCSDQFWLSDLTAKKFRAEWTDQLFVGSFADDATALVEFDQDDDGTYETPLDPSQWQADPVDRDLDRPLNTINLMSGLTFPGSWRVSPSRNYYTGYGFDSRGNGFPSSRRARVQVTARWGWPSVPPQVVQACQIISIANYKSKDLTGGIGGSTSVATGAFGAKRDILIKPAQLEPMAIAALHGLRQIVVA